MTFIIFKTSKFNTVRDPKSGAHRPCAPAQFSKPGAHQVPILTPGAHRTGAPVKIKNMGKYVENVVLFLGKILNSVCEWKINEISLTVVATFSFEFFASVDFPECRCSTCPCSTIRTKCPQECPSSNKFWDDCTSVTGHVIILSISYHKCLFATRLSANSAAAVFIPIENCVDGIRRSFALLWHFISVAQWN